MNKTGSTPPIEYIYIYIYGILKHQVIIGGTFGVVLMWNGCEPKLYTRFILILDIGGDDILCEWMGRWRKYIQCEGQVYLFQFQVLPATSTMLAYFSAHSCYSQVLLSLHLLVVLLIVLTQRVLLISDDGIEVVDTAEAFNQLGV